MSILKTEGSYNDQFRTDTIVTTLAGIGSSAFSDLDADLGGGSSSGAAGADVAALLPFLHDKDAFPDLFFVRLNTKPSPPANPGHVYIRFGYVNAGQAPAAAVLANQFLTPQGLDLMASSTLVDTKYEITPLPKAKIPEGGLIFIWLSRSPTNMAGLRAGMRWRERRLDEV